MSKGGDSDEVQMVDKAAAVAFRMAKEAGTEFVTPKWVANKLKRSETFVRTNLNNSDSDRVKRHL
ncbi:MAG: hypothetical protein GY820_30330 [Gammaproteobacteria bacterium]|nr:hypothetical protein [Gammaproteobacteria bacterium]